MVIDPHQEPEIQIILQREYPLLLIVDGVLDIVPEDPHEQQLVYRLGGIGTVLEEDHAEGGEFGAEAVVELLVGEEDRQLLLVVGVVGRAELGVVSPVVFLFDHV